MREDPSDRNLRIALSRPAPAVVVAVAVAAVVLLGAARWLAGPDYAFSALFLIPIALVAWYVGAVAGQAVAVLAILLWVWDDVHTVDHFASFWVPLLNAVLRLMVFIAAALVVAALRRAMDRIQDLALRDPLTGLANRRAFLAAAEDLVALCRRNHDPVALLFLDVDRFKELNDRRGHAEGDLVLRELADVLGQAVRASDVVCRWGGDEFLILLPQTEAEGAEVVRSGLERVVRDRLTARWGVTVSVGTAAWARVEAGVDELLREADRLLYRAKSAPGGGAAR